MNTFKLSTIRNLKNFCQELHSDLCYRKVISELQGDNLDFEIDNVRFIADSIILDVLTEELASDEYILGCFDSGFIASCTKIPVEIIEACQQAEAYEALGKGILALDKVGVIAVNYATAEGYGHHFNYYDSNEEEITINGVLFHVFDNH